MTNVYISLNQLNLIIFIDKNAKKSVAIAYMVFPVNFNVVRMRLKQFLVDCVRMKKKFEIQIAKKGKTKYNFIP